MPPVLDARNRMAAATRAVGKRNWARCRHLQQLRHPLMQEWIAAAKLEPDELEELDVEF